MACGSLDDGWSSRRLHCLLRDSGTPEEFFNNATPPREGIPTFNVDNSSHFAGKQQAFFYFELHANEIVCREYQTTDAWETGSWTPQHWTAPIGQVSS